MKIKQEITIKSTAKDIFEALTNSKKFTEMSGVPAEIDAKEGGKFTCFGGMISGQTIEMEPSQLLVQVWRVKNWDKGVYSLIKFELEEVNDSSTKLLFEHLGFPDDQKTHLESGWFDNYWNPLKIYLEG